MHTSSWATEHEDNGDDVVIKGGAIAGCRHGEGGLEDDRVDGAEMRQGLNVPCS